MSAREQVSPREAHTLVVEKGHAYLDVRTVPEFATGHAPGAYNVPLLVPSAEGMLENPQFLAEVAGAFEKSTKLIVMCASGVRSLRAAELLRAAGFVEVLEQHAGMEGLRDPFGRVKQKGHRDEGLPIASESQPGRSHDELCARSLAAGGSPARGPAST
jgi:rhodanese-related sulfurtransferase